MTKKPKTAFNFIDFMTNYSSEQNCIKLLEDSRWKGIPVCIHCQHDKVYRLKDQKTLKCAKCRKRFTARQGTIFEESPLPLSKWFYAIYVFSNHKKGISSCQLAKDLGVTQKTAWFMLGRIRYAMKSKSFTKQLEGTVEADETYIGGKPRKSDGKVKRGRGSEKKTPVFGMLERDGDVIMLPVEHVDKKTLQSCINDNVAEDSTVMTDEWGAYNGLASYYFHEVINHADQEYVRGNIHVNGMEGVWSQLKRGIGGIYHHASRKHLHRYCDEFAFRHNTSDENDKDRFILTIGKIETRLTYNNLIKPVKHNG